MPNQILIYLLLIYFTICETQVILRGDQEILASDYDYDYISDIDNGPIRGDLADVNESVENGSETKVNKRKKRSLEPIVRGDQGPPPEFDYYSNFVDEEPVRGDLGQLSKNLSIQHVISGSTADITRFPYQVSLTHYNNYTEQWENVCGGSIISPNIVVTTAHCIYSISLHQISTFRVRIGSSSSTSGGKLMKISRIINHEYFNNWNMDNDIALIVLSHRIKFSKKINKISISSNCRIAGTMSVVSGWGYLDEKIGIPSPNLNFVKIPLIDPYECRKLFKNIKHITNSMICAGYLFGTKNPCAKTDLGGPLVEGDELIGIVSSTGECGRFNIPGVYTDIFYMRKWIIDKLNIYSL